MRSMRIDDIENYIYEKKTVTLNQLCEKFNVSKNTIRRDLDEITTKGTIKKIYGGVTVSSTNKNELVSFNERNIKNLKCKQTIAEKASTFIENGDIIFIDSGTTTVHMIDYIKDKKNITILTNSIEIILHALPYENINIISLSGALNRKTLSFTGQSAANVLKSYNISKSFMSSTGISIENGATNSSTQEFDIKRTAVERGNQVYLLVDSHKFGVISLMTFASLEEIDYLITDETPPYEISELFRKEGKALILPY